MLLSVIRRWHFRDGMPIREISRRTGLYGNTIRKYLTSGVVEPRYPKRKSPSKLDGYELILTSWLFRESRRHRKQHKTLKQLHSDLMQLRYTRSCDRIAAFTRHWRQEHQQNCGLSLITLVHSNYAFIVITLQHTLNRSMLSCRSDADLPSGFGARTNGGLDREPHFQSAISYVCYVLVPAGHGIEERPLSPLA